MRRAMAGGVSPRSRATTPKPPPWIRRSAALRACSALCAERTQISRSRRTPAAAADEGWKASSASTKAQTSSLSVACARIESSRLVRPEEAGPKISVRQPRGRPPVAWSTSGMPEQTHSGDGRDCQFREPSSSDSNCFLRATAGMLFSLFIRLHNLYRKAAVDVNGWKARGIFPMLSLSPLL